MIYGLIRFIFKGIIFNPMALLGIACGYFIMKYYGIDNIDILLTMPAVYGALIGIAFLYALAFRHVYKPDSAEIDWVGTALGSFKCLFDIILAAAVTCGVIYAMNYGVYDKVDSYLRHNDTTQTATSNEGVPINQSSY